MGGRALLRRIAALPPPLILALLYAVLVAAGAGLLLLPVSHHAPMTLADAAFMSTSAVTMTGLAVIDVAADLTVFGQVVLIALVQMGGIGVMAFAVLVLQILGLPLGIAGQTFLREDLHQSSMHQLPRLVRTIARVVVVCELAGALAMLPVFVPDFGLLRGAWIAVFHAVTAFNNAGFTNIPGGLTGYVTAPLLNLAIPALFVVGGLGYLVLHEVWTRRAWAPLSLHSKIMLAGSAVLIPASVALFAVLEWTNPATLGGFPALSDRLWVSWFQGLTPRTAGFNTIDTAATRDSTTTMTLALMLIGGGPTSTAGGIKVTTVAVMLLAAVAFFRRQTQLHAFGRSIGLEQVLRVMALTAIGLVLAFVGLFLITATHDGDFLDIAFEVTSAFGTVGLSRGFTEELNGFGRGVIIALMFIGRVGPLTLGFFLASKAVPRVRYPEGQIHLG